MKSNNVQILFQKTNDKRVESFLSKSLYNTKIIDFDSWIRLSNDFEILCFKDGFYDSGLAIKTSDKTILNLNDCVIDNSLRCEEVLKITGECDILASQFSYAAWKGGENNRSWRELAAKEKIETLKLQASFFKPKIIVPFASYAFFSNKANFYLNDASNKPIDVIDAFKSHDSKVKVMQPFETLDNLDSKIDNNDSINFWGNSIKNIAQKSLNEYEIISLNQLKESYKDYRKRIFKKNKKWFMRLIRYLSPIPAFKPLVIRLSDLNINIKLDIFEDTIQECNMNADIAMHSESLDFLFGNTFGFDTLTVNGCFEELSESGFSKMARSLALENLNNMGIEFRPSIILRHDIITIFISRLWAVSKKIKLAKNS